MKNDIPTFILPAAGFGKRVGSPKAKELLPDPVTGEPLIDWSLDLALKTESRVIVISRQEKIELNTYIKMRSSQDKRIELHTLTSSREWPDSILQVREAWGERNLVLLPDTRFDSLTVPTQMLNHLDESTRVAFAVFRPESFSKWGVLVPEENGFSGCEKPQEPDEILRGQKAWAWGFFAFKKDQGVALLRYLLKSTFDHSWYEWKNKVCLVETTNFIDLARDRTFF